MTSAHFRILRSLTLTGIAMSAAFMFAASSAQAERRTVNMKSTDLKSHCEATGGTYQAGVEWYFCTYTSCPEHGGQPCMITCKAGGACSSAPFKPARKTNLKDIIRGDQPTKAQ